MNPAPRVNVASENALIIYFDRRPCPAVSSQIAITGEKLKAYLGPALIDLVPSYASLLVIFDLAKTDHHSVRRAIDTAIDRSKKASVSHAVNESGSLVTLPVYYSEESGPDLQLVANNAGLTVDEVIAIHQQGQYQVYAIGFAPGFAYLGEVDPRIASPRLATPRLQVPQGAVGIADRQTAVYPARSPGGWNLIGLCPVLMFDPNSSPSMQVQVGDRVRFEAVDRATFLSMGGQL